MTETISSRVQALGLTLPTSSAPAANYIPFVVTGHLAFISGQIAQMNGERPYLGKLGAAPEALRVSSLRSWKSTGHISNSFPEYQAVYGSIT